MKRLAPPLIFAISLLLTAACGPIDIGGLFGNGEEPFSSNQATLLDFEFSGSFTTTSSWNYESQAEDQLLYTIGHLNWDNSLGRLDKLELTNIESTNEGNGFYTVTYDAKLPVGWGSKTNLPSSYTFELPSRVDWVGMSDFSNKYSHDCADFGAHDVDAGSFWYYYRPQRSSCSFDDADVVTIEATVTVSEENTKSKYPEYHKVWEDDELTVLAVFGKYEDGATSSTDAGISAYNRFSRAVKNELGNVTTVPTNVPSSPGVGMPDIEFRSVMDGGRSITINALLVDNVRTAGSEFNQRYAELSADADLIVYSGHAGLGANIRALAQKGTFVPGKYQVFFMNGCDTFAYVDSALAERKMEINPDDPNGTKYLDIVTNLMPSYFHSMANATMELVTGLAHVDNPETYDEMFEGIDRAEVVVVTGEEDNVYFPGYNGGEWDGLEVTTSVAQGAWDRYSTGEVAAGTYVFEMTHDPADATGDADLYVRVGAEPDASSYDCRPYIGGSDETCTVTLTQTGVIHIAVTGYSTGMSPYILVGTKLDDGGDRWDGMTEAGNVDQGADVRFTTDSLGAGSYTISIAHDPNNDGGDADLYVRVGNAPSTSTYDCRPYLNGSNETCNVTLTSAARIHIMVRGYASGTSYFVLTGSQN